MGSCYISKKQEADYLKKIQIFLLRKHGFLKGGYVSGTMKWGSNFFSTESSINIAVSSYDQSAKIELSYSLQPEEGHERTKIEYALPITSTNCYFGGVRYWFICNLTSNGIYCGKRVAVLYKGGDYFACRHCYNLSYESRNENRRYKDYLLFRTLITYKKIDELQRCIKRRFYRGKPTKQQKKLNKLYFESIY